MRHLARDCPNRGTRDDSGINLKRAFGSFVGMTGDRDVSLPVLTTNSQQEIVQYSDFNMSHVPVVFWLSLLVLVEQFLFRWCHQTALSSAKHGCSFGTQTEPQSIPPPQGQRPIVARDESNDGNTKQVPRVPGSVFRDLLAAARQMDETMVSTFTAACSFQRLDLALVNPGTVQTILVNDVTAAGGTAEKWSDGDLTTLRGAQKLRDWIMMENHESYGFVVRLKTARRLKMIISQQLSLALVISPGNIASSVTCPIWHQTWHLLVNVILCSRFRRTVEQCALEVAFMNV